MFNNTLLEVFLWGIIWVICYRKSLVLSRFHWVFNWDGRCIIGIVDVSKRTYTAKKEAKWEFQTTKCYLCHFWPFLEALQPSWLYLFPWKTVIQKVSLQLISSHFWCKEHVAIKFTSRSLWYTYE